MYISSKANPLIKKIKSLELKKNRNKLGLFVLEGKKFTDDALNSGFICEHIIIEENSRIDPSEYNDPITVSKEVFSTLSDTKSPQGILGVFRIPEYELDINSMRRILFLDGVQQSENVGALIRSAVCCGYDAVLLTDKCADAFSPKSVRSSAGAALRIGIHRADANTLYHLRVNDFAIIGSSLKGEAVNLNYEKTVLIVGSEGQGMTREAEEQCTVLVKIPILGDCESLNASVAGGILMYKTIGY